MNLLYYISDGKSQEGPFTKEELINKKLIRTTLVWREGFEKWLPITNVSELAFLLEKLPPPLPEATIPPSVLPEQQTKDVGVEISSEMETQEQPDNVTFAIVLHIITLSIVLVHSLAEKEAFMSYYSSLYGDVASAVYNMSIWGAIVLWGVYLILLYHRQNWARIVYLVFFIIGILFLPFTLEAASSMEIPGLGTSVICGIANFGAMILLFTPSSNRWFNRR